MFMVPNVLTAEISTQVLSLLPSILSTENLLELCTEADLENLLSHLLNYSKIYQRKVCRNSSEEVTDKEAETETETLVDEDERKLNATLSTGETKESENNCEVKPQKNGKERRDIASSEAKGLRRKLRSKVIELRVKKNLHMVSLFDCYKAAEEEDSERQPSATKMPVYVLCVLLQSQSDSRMEMISALNSDSRHLEHNVMTSVGETQIAMEVVCNMRSAQEMSSIIARSLAHLNNDIQGVENTCQYLKKMVSEKKQLLKLLKSFSPKPTNGNQGNPIQMLSSEHDLSEQRKKPFCALETVLQEMICTMNKTLEARN